MLARGSGTREHLDLAVLWTECLATNDIPHVVLRDHGGLELREVVAVPHYSLVEVTAVLDEARELVHSQLLRIHRLYHLALD